MMTAFQTSVNVLNGDCCPDKCLYVVMVTVGRTSVPTLTAWDYEGRLKGAVSYTHLTLPTMPDV